MAERSANGDSERSVDNRLLNSRSLETRVLRKRFVSNAEEDRPDYDDDDTPKEFREESKAIVICMNYQKHERKNDGPYAYITDEIFTDKLIYKNTDAPEYSDVNKIMSNDELQADVILKQLPQTTTSPLHRSSQLPTAATRPLTMRTGESFFAIELHMKRQIQVFGNLSKILESETEFAHPFQNAISPF